MKPEEGRHQTATQVKVLSPEILQVIEADLVHIKGKLYCASRYGEAGIVLSGSKAAV